MNEPSGDPPARTIRRRWFQCSLRSFLVAVTIGCVWLGWKVETDRRQRETVSAIKAMGGIVTTDREDGIPQHVHFRRPPFLYHGVTYWPQHTLTDDGMNQVGSLTTVEWLAISDIPITDAGLMRIHRLQSLRRIFLHHTQVTDGGVARLQKALPKCEVFYFR